MLMRSLIDFAKRFSPKHVLIRRADGETERHAVTSGLTLNTDDVIQVMTGNGGGLGRPDGAPPGVGETRPRERLHHARAGEPVLWPG